MITVQTKNECMQLPANIKRSCLVCGSNKWIKLTLVKGVGLQGTSIALCPKCAQELADKIYEKTGGLRS